MSTPNPFHDPARTAALTQRIHTLAAELPRPACAGCCPPTCAWSPGRAARCA
jgi:hypothetical protein